MAAISTGNRPADVERFRDQTGAKYPFYLDDGRAAKAFGIVASPTCVLVAPDGSIRYRGTAPPKE